MGWAGGMRCISIYLQSCSVCFFVTGCDYPPEEAATVQERLQAQLSKGQVYLMHSSEELSYVIKNSDFNNRSDSDQDKLIKSVEEAALAILSKYEEFKTIRIYFVGDGAGGINRPYLCKTVSSSCVKVVKQ